MLRSQLPENSSIKILLGVSVPCGQYQMALSGGVLEASGEAPLRGVRWSSMSDEELLVDILAYALLPIDDQLLINASKRAEEGLNEVVPRRQEKKALKSDK